MKRFRQFVWRILSRALGLNTKRGANDLCLYFCNKVYLSKIKKYHFSRYFTSNWAKRDWIPSTHPRFSGVALPTELYFPSLIFYLNKNTSFTVFYFKLGQEGFEPSTTALKGHCSTNWAIGPYYYGSNTASNSHIRVSYL